MANRVLDGLRVIDPNIQMRDDLADALNFVRDDPDVRAVIFSGVGRAYCAGADLSEFGTALRLAMTGERIDAAEAHRVGLVHKVVSKEVLLDEAEATVRKVLVGGPFALRMAKEAIRRGLGLPLEEALRLESKLADLVLASDEARRGLDSWGSGTTSDAT